jgi:aspartate/methionine/tyrosine aminotransferase
MRRNGAHLRRCGQCANVCITAGCNQAFMVAMLALARAGDAVLLPAPWYFNHKMALDMLGIEARPCPAGPRTGLCPMWTRRQN